MAKKAPAPKSKPAPRKRDREATKSKLLKAGLEVFSKIGYDAATTQMVAKKAGVNEALISRYFDGKSGLLAEILIAYLAEAAKSSEHAYPVGKTVEEEIKNFMTFYFHNDIKNRDFLRVTISRAAVDPKFRNKIANLGRTMGHPFFAQRLELFKKSGDIKLDLDLMELSRVVCTQCLGMMFITGVISTPNTDDILRNLHLAATTFAQGIRPTDA